MMNTKPLGNPDLFKIGHVAQQTGVSVALLRAWERRYGLEPAERINSHRYYSRQQVDRIKKIKELTEQGHPVGQLFDLDEAEISRRLGEVDQSEALINEEPLEMILIGRELFKYFNDANSTVLEEIDRFTTFEEFRQQALEFTSQLDDSDLVVLYQSTLKLNQLELLRTKTHTPILLVCRYLEEKDIHALRKKDIYVTPRVELSAIESTVLEIPRYKESQSNLELPDTVLESDELEKLAASEKDQLVKGVNIVALIDEVRSYEEHLYMKATSELQRNVAKHVTEARDALERAATEVIQTQSLLIRS